jgi:hypothetical protein
MFIRYEFPLLAIMSLLIKMLAATYLMSQPLILFASSMGLIDIVQMTIAILFHIQFCFFSYYTLIKLSSINNVKKMVGYVTPIAIA